MDELFLRILNMSAAASVTGLAVAVLRALLRRRLPRWTFYLMWGLVLVRLLLPFSVPSPLSAFEVIPTARVQETSGGTVLAFVEDNGASVDFPTLQDGPMFPREPVVAPARVRVVTILAAIWICGVVLLLLYSAACYAYAISRLRTAERLEHTPELDALFVRCGVCPRRVRLYRSGAFQSPVVCGLIRPRLIFSELVNSEDLPYVTAHELTHIRRCDNLFKAAATLALYLHWFNPLIWLFYHWYVTDMEASCDEAAIRRQGADRRAYSYCLVNMAARSRSAFSGGVLAFGECALRERVQSILHLRKTTLLLSMFCAAVLLGLAVVFLTNPQPTQPGSGGPALSATESVLSRQDGDGDAKLAGKLLGGILPDEVKRMTVEGPSGEAAEADAAMARAFAEMLGGLELQPLEAEAAGPCREVTIWRTGEAIVTLLVGEDWLTIEGALPELEERGSVSAALTPEDRQQLEDCLLRMTQGEGASSTTQPSSIQQAATVSEASPAEQVISGAESEISGLPALNPENPPCLRIPCDTVDEMNLIDRNTHTSCAVTGEDREDILALLNQLTPQEELAVEPDPQGLRLLQVRLLDGTKYDFWCYSNLLMEGETQLADAEQVRKLYSRFREVEQKAYGRGQAAAEWLGYMNPYRITSMEIENGLPGERLRDGDRGGTARYEATASEQARDAILEVAEKLKALTVIPDRATAPDKGEAPVDSDEVLLDRRSIRLDFENGTEGYTILLYREGRIDIYVDSIDYYTSYQTTGDGSLEALLRALAAYGGQ